MGNASAGGLAFIPAGATGTGAGTGTSVTGNLSMTLNTNGLAFNGQNLAGIGLTTATTTGTNLVGTNNTAGLSLGVPAWLTAGAAQSTQTQPAGNIAGVGTSVTGNLSMTLNSNGLAFNGTNLAGVGTSITGNLSMTMNTAGLALNASNLAGTATAITGNASITLNTAGLSFNGSNIAGVGTSITGNASMTLNSAGLAFNGSNLAGVGTSITGNASITLNSAGLQFNGSNLAGVGTTFAGANLSASATFNSAGLNLSMSAANVTTVSRWINIQNGTVGGASQPNASVVSIGYVALPNYLAMSGLRFAFSQNQGTTTNNSSAYADYSMSAVLYSRNGSTLSSILSGSNTYTGSYSSNAGNMAQMAAVTLSWNASTILAPGEYWVAVHMSSTNTATGGANTTALANSFSMVVGNLQNAAINIAPFNVAANNTQAATGGVGIISTGATVASIPWSSISQTGSNGSLANIWLDFRNYSLF